MKTRTLLVLGAALALASARVTGVETSNSPAANVGLYDSRIVAYAHFWSEPARKERDSLIAEARAAKAAGDTLRFKDLNARLVAAQKRSHLQVFSTAPASEAMAVLRDKLPALQQELGVTSVVSLWDEAAVAAESTSARIDVTDRLVREFLPSPDANQLKVIASMKNAKPLPLAEATKLADEGKL